jgi:hypothetical protein
MRGLVGGERFVRLTLKASVRPSRRDVCTTRVQMSTKRVYRVCTSRGPGVYRESYTRARIPQGAVCTADGPRDPVLHAAPPLRGFCPQGGTAPAVRSAPAHRGPFDWAPEEAA